MTWKLLEDCKCGGLTVNVGNTKTDLKVEQQ